MLVPTTTLAALWQTGCIRRALCSCFASDGGGATHSVWCARFRMLPSVHQAGAPIGLGKRGAVHHTCTSAFIPSPCMLYLPQSSVMFGDAAPLYRMFHPARPPPLHCVECSSAERRPWAVLQ